MQCLCLTCHNASPVCLCHLSQHVPHLSQCNVCASPVTTPHLCVCVTCHMCLTCHNTMFVPHLSQRTPPPHSAITNPHTEQLPPLGSSPNGLPLSIFIAVWPLLLAPLPQPKYVLATAHTPPSSLPFPHPNTHLPQHTHTPPRSPSPTQIRSCHSTHTPLFAPIPPPHFTRPTAHPPPSSLPSLSPNTHLPQRTPLSLLPFLCRSCVALPARFQHLNNALCTNTTCIRRNLNSALTK